MRLRGFWVALLGLVLALAAPAEASAQGGEAPGAPGASANWTTGNKQGLGTSVALARRLGLETETVIEALGGGPLVSPWEAAKLQRIARGDYSAQFALALALKDVHLALEAVDANRFTAFAALAHEWERAVDHGLGNEDITVVTQALQDGTR